MGLIYRGWAESIIAATAASERASAPAGNGPPPASSRRIRNIWSKRSGGFDQAN